MFQIGDKVVHPIYGAGTIQSIEERQDREARSKYYVIPDTTEADRLLVPVEAASAIGLRRAVSNEDAQEIVRLIHSEAQALAPERLDRVALLKKIDWTDPYVVAEIWRDLSVEAKNGKVCAATEKVRKRARRLLLSELCLATGMSSQQCGLVIDECGDEAH
jgi:CarD family transcriptional regulator